jgi:hypothetical protein
MSTTEMSRQDYINLIYRILRGSNEPVERPLPDPWNTAINHAFEADGDPYTWKEMCERSLNGQADSIVAEVFAMLFEPEIAKPGDARQGEATDETGKQFEYYKTTTLAELLDGPTTIDWIVESIIPPGGLVFMPGNSGVGKTWLILTLIIAIATGRPWLGKFKVKQGPVLVVDRENSDLLLRIRLLKILKAMNVNPKDVPIHFLIRQMKEDGRVVSEPPIDLTPNPDGSPSESLTLLYNTAYRINPVLTVFDSFSRMHSLDDSKQQDMSKIERQLRKLLEVSQAILPTHHITKAGARSKEVSGQDARGSGDIRAGGDLFLMVSAHEEGIQVTPDKERWTEPLNPFLVSMTFDKAADTADIKFEKWLERKAKQEKIDVWAWLYNTLKTNGEMTRKDLVELAESMGVCKSSKLDEILAEKSAYLNKVHRGKPVYISLRELPPVQISMLDGRLNDGRRS